MAYEKELTAAEVKAKAKECGADIVGIAPMSRWEGTDKQHDPRYIFPGAKSMIVMGVTTFAWVTVTLLTPPTDAVKRASFQNKIRANGHDIAWGLLAMTVACVCIYAMMFASGYWIYGRTTLAVTMTAIAAVSGIGLFPILGQLAAKGEGR